ncbi:helix-turn-helix transcriptional regulator [Actinoplanes sp. NPDC049802]|uniref:helix-turn-helix transcriptional regulator n=1 Tax=Actinoplanes sp. NPDC049802 TaxID=3154742 RepID=UPI003406CD54
MPRKKKPLEPIPDSEDARRTKVAIHTLLAEIIRLATGTGDLDVELSAADRRRVLTWLSGHLTFSSNSHRFAAKEPFVETVARHRYHAVAAGLRLGLTIEQVAAEAGVSPSGISQITIRHQEHFDSDPVRRQIAKQRRLDAARRAADRKKADTSKQQGASHQSTTDPRIAEAPEGGDRVVGVGDWPDDVADAAA